MSGVIKLLPHEPLMPLLRYGLVAGIVGSMALLQYALGTTLEGHVFFMFFPAVFFAGLMLDRWCGVFAVGLSALTIAWFWLEPLGTLWIANAGDALALLLFVIGGLIVATVTEALHESLETLHRVRKESEVLVQDIHRRIRRDVQSVSPLRRQGKGRTSDSDAVDRAVERIGILCRAYTCLRPDQRGVTIDARSFIVGLVEDLGLAMAGVRPIIVRAAAEDAELGIDCGVRLGIIINELVAEAFRHAFPSTDLGHIDVTFRREDDEYVLTVADNGIGVTELVDEDGAEYALAQRLALQLEGYLDVRSEHGVRVSLRFPLRAATAA
ncbi:MAG TPA: DUF4118 domain-containing protein [Azospirillum sp.]|nr:DUF4118 domain-containing protein [Azospirillum sp.]